MGGAPRLPEVWALAWLVLCLGAPLLGADPPEPPVPPRPSASPPSAPAVAVPSSAARSNLAVGILTRRRVGVPARSAALLMSGQQGGSIPIAVLAVPVAASPEKTRVFFVADIEGTNLLAGQEKPTVQVEIYAYAVTTQGSVGGDLAESFTLGLEQAIDLLSQGSIKFLSSIDVPPGAFALRVLVRNAQVGSFGITEVPRVTPPAEGTFAFLSPLLVGEPAAPWVVAREAGDERWGSAGHPFSFLPEGSLPSTKPVLASGTNTILWALARGAAPGVATMPIKVVGREGKEITRFEATVLERRDSGLAGATLLRLRLPVPALDPAPYLFELSAEPMTPGAQLTSSIGVVVADPKTVEAQRVWVQFGTPRQSGEEEAQRRASFTGRAGRSKASAKVAGEYRSVLEKICSQPLPKVLDALAELERASLPTGSAAEWETLVASETRVAEEVAAVRPMSALALAYLHGELYRGYLQKKMYLLATHARRMTEELAVLYAEKAGKEANPVVADILAGLVGSLQELDMLGTAERLFRRALGFDPTNRASLIGLGAGLERMGQYRLAARFLSQLVEVDPANSEARLRLAVNLERLNEHRRSTGLLTECTGEKNPRWVRVVAYQEMAAALIRAGRFGAAHDLLAEAVTKFPGDEPLAIALAYVLDRLRKPLEARIIADRLRASPRGEGDSPRFRYSQWPVDDLERSQEAASDAGKDAIQALREVLLPAHATGGSR
jgi:Flp pilus assembly protein TadD